MFKLLDKKIFNVTLKGPMSYCKPGNFRENLFSRIASKDLFATFKNSRLGHTIPISVNDRVISRGFYFHETYMKIKPSQKKSEFIVYWDC